MEHIQLLDAHELRKIYIDNMNNPNKIKVTIDQCLDYIKLCQDYTNQDHIIFDKPLPVYFLDKLRSENYTIDIKTNDKNSENKFSYVIRWKTNKDECNTISPTECKKCNYKERLISFLNYYGKYYDFKNNYVPTDYKYYKCLYPECKMNNISNPIPEDFKKELEDKHFIVNLTFQSKRKYEDEYRFVLCGMQTVSYMFDEDGLYKYIIKYKNQDSNHRKNKFYSLFKL